jgi:hypothetical protein
VAILRFIILAATCVFAKQSLGPILCGQLQLKGACPSHLPLAPLIPKLRGHFAEFLFHGSLEHLRLLASPTCVGLRYGRKCYSHTRLFLAASSKALGQIKSGSRRPVSYLKRRICLPLHTTPLHRDVLHPTALLLPRPPLRSDATFPAHEY